MDVGDALLGSPKQWKDFVARNAGLVGKLGELNKAFETLLNRRWRSSGALDEFIFISGHQAVDDFIEIFVLCGNAEGLGAFKLLRPLFERVVTTRFLDEHPEEFHNFWDYYWIDQHKLAVALEEMMGPDIVDKPSRDEIEQNYNAVKDRYRVTVCKECGTSRPAISWTPKDIVSMAKHVKMSVFLLPAYYVPLQQSHTKVSATLDRITERADGTLVPKERQDPARADQALCYAHALLIRMLEVQTRHFKLDAAIVEGLRATFEEVWNGRDLGPNPGPLVAHRDF